MAGDCSSKGGGGAASAAAPCGGVGAGGSQQRSMHQTPEQRSMHQALAPAGDKCCSSTALGNTPAWRQSIYQVARELKREQHTAFNCLASIVADAAFIQEMRVLYADLPCLANLRAGGWYVPAPDGTCYFKSTDGHQNNCTFSVTRLNWHVAELAAQRGGVIIVDATRKGKRFPVSGAACGVQDIHGRGGCARWTPDTWHANAKRTAQAHCCRDCCGCVLQDALSKTIPIWAAVLNRAVARVRAHDAEKERRRRTYACSNGDVLSPVTDTQTSISVRQDGAAAGGGSSCRSHQADAPANSSNSSSIAGTDAFEQRTQPSHQQQHAGMLLPPQPAALREQHTPMTPEQRPLPGGSLSAPGCRSCSEDASHCSTAAQVLQLLGECTNDSMDLLSAVGGGAGAGAAAAMGMAPSAPGAPAAAAGAPVMTLGDPVAAAAQGAAISPAGCGAVRPLVRSRSVHLSPQPSLHEWLDERDMLRRLALLAESRSAARVASCRLSAAGAEDGAARHACQQFTGADSASAAHVRYGASAPAGSRLGACLDCGEVCGAELAAQARRDRGASDSGSTARRSEAPGTLRAQGDACTPSCDAAQQLAGCTTEQPALLPTLQLPTAASRQVLAPAGVVLGSHGSAAACAAEAHTEPGTPRLGSVGSAAHPASSSDNSSHASSQQRQPLTERAWQASAAEAQPGVVSGLRQQPQQHVQQHLQQPADVALSQHLRHQQQGQRVLEFAFPSPQQLAVSAGSAGGAERDRAGVAPGLASSRSSSSVGSGVVRLPDMPVVVLNGTSHQPGDAASILNTWRGERRLCAGA
jgi:hypothetical protein